MATSQVLANILDIGNYDIRKQGKIGHAYIFHNTEFDDKPAASLRCDGIKKDVKGLKGLLEEMRFEVDNLDNCKNLTQSSFFTKVSNITKMKYNDDVFLAVFISHGNKGEIALKDGNVSINTILKKFREDKCTYLSGKPKIFLFANCQGRNFQGYTINEGISDMADVDLAGEEPKPVGANFIVCYATESGYRTLVHISDGSWFIQAFIEVLKAYAKCKNDMEFTTLITAVNYNVSNQTIKEPVKDKIHITKQMPCFTSTLLKNLFLPKPTSTRSTKKSEKSK